mmetsp:Transcript_118080/g.329159  ORF Transcript_118080/g.329159 Transcript_118080/m.329159 type:complete len:431 (+) Transcript_118080:723-2015(+)
MRKSVTPWVKKIENTYTVRRSRTMSQKRDRTEWTIEVTMSRNSARKRRTRTIRTIRAISSTRPVLPMMPPALAASAPGLRSARKSSIADIRTSAMSRRLHGRALTRKNAAFAAAMRITSSTKNTPANALSAMEKTCGSGSSPNSRMRYSVCTPMSRAFRKIIVAKKQSKAGCETTGARRDREGGECLRGTGELSTPPVEHWPKSFAAPPLGSPPGLAVRSASCKSGLLGSGLAHSPWPLRSAPPCFGLCSPSGWLSGAAAASLFLAGRFLWGGLPSRAPALLLRGARPALQGRNVAGPACRPITRSNLRCCSKFHLSTRRSSLEMRSMTLLNTKMRSISSSPRPPYSASPLPAIPRDADRARPQALAWPKEHSSSFLLGTRPPTACLTSSTMPPTSMGSSCNSNSWSVSQSPWCTATLSLSSPSESLAML